MRKFLFGLSIVTTLGVWVLDSLLQFLPAFRNGWWSLLFFLVPLAAIVLAWSPDRKGKLGAASVALFVLSLGAYVSTRTIFFRISGTPAVALGEKAPDFTLKDQEGRDVSLSDQKGRVVLVFFRGKG